VLRGIDYNNFRTKCFIIETHGQLSRDYDIINRLLNENGYSAMLRNELNTFWFDKNFDCKGRLEHICSEFSDYKIIRE